MTPRRIIIRATASHPRGQIRARLSFPPGVEVGQKHAEEFLAWVGDVAARSDLLSPAKRSGRPRKIAAEDVPRILGQRRLSASELERALMNACSVVESSAKSAMARAVAGGLVVKLGRVYSLPDNLGSF